MYLENYLTIDKNMETNDLIGAIKIAPFKELFHGFYIVKTKCKFSLLCVANISVFSMYTCVCVYKLYVCIQYVCLCMYA